MSWVLFNPDAESAEIATELAMEPIWFGVIALIAFLVLLLVTFAFRSVHTRH